MRGISVLRCLHVGQRVEFPRHNAQYSILRFRLLVLDFGSCKVAAASQRYHFAGFHRVMNLFHEELILVALGSGAR